MHPCLIRDRGTFCRFKYFPGVQLFPLNQIKPCCTALEPNQTRYLHCKDGMRSLKALYFLRLQGFNYLKSVKGSITTWSGKVDSKVVFTGNSNSSLSFVPCPR